MTYCLAIAVDEGLLFASDSRTSAGPDQVSTYGKMHVFGIEGDRQIVLLSSGNLATSQAVVGRIAGDIRGHEAESVFNTPSMSGVAEYLGWVMREEGERHAAALARSGYGPETTFIVGGQIGDAPPELFLVYPQGNFITTSEQTPYLQLGEVKYGRAVIDRIVGHLSTLDEAARCAVVSMDSTMRGNAAVGPPIELLAYRRDSLVVDCYKRLKAGDEYLVTVRRQWTEKLVRAFGELPVVSWERPPQAPPSELLSYVRERQA